MTASAAPKSVGDVDSFITMLQTACRNQAVYERLEQLLSLPDTKRQALLHAWITDLLIAQAPKDFIQALACLMDDRVAEKAYEVIYQCRREERASADTAYPTSRWHALDGPGGLLLGIAVLAIVFLGVLLW